MAARGLGQTPHRCWCLSIPAANSVRRWKESDSLLNGQTEPFCRPIARTKPVWRPDHRAERSAPSTAAQSSLSAVTQAAVVVALDLTCPAHLQGARSIVCSALFWCRHVRNVEPSVLAQPAQIIRWVTFGQQVGDHCTRRGQSHYTMGKLFG